ncbi:DUF6090 family protein [Winogradskyella sp. A3E31]|uniref:DUF6090 family protein n=1 Tax=Winogradskyella sp. A3E31 TaxID=3349637 RepID=UPI00398ADA84
MIKFFRHIRQSMINQNRTKKYLLYAIGEIVLVVIGILIALQINNWNEKRKERVREHKYLNRLLNEIERDSSNLDWSIRLTSQKTKQAENLLKHFNTTIAIQDSSVFVNDAFLAGRGGSFYPNIHAYQELLATGDVGIIQNENITEQIARYIKRVEGFESFIYRDGETRRTKYNDHLHHYFSALIMNEIWKEDFGEYVELKVLNDLGIDIEGFIKDSNSAYHIRNMAALNLELNRLYTQTMERYILEILKELRKELQLK